MRDSEEEWSIKERVGEIKDVLKLLPEQYRTILYLREHQQFTYDELTVTMDLSLEQVKVNLYRDRKRFKQLSERLGKSF
ncbi:sigma factor-like helix-turn-helix DNA-binding protein [Halalkalibacter kiskunsagensis]|uniref:Sigma factor-like helix-turn-helix DNA-binding protein n=1 Tax=Halalkalibacter kiskunsagensis TaxID=1548599 RepID=A0ABV6KBK4_9BACI